MMIYEMRDVTDEICQAFQRLIPQLTEYSSPPSREMLMAMAKSDSIFVFLFKQPEQDGSIAGTATLATFLTPTGTHAWIEDVIVDRDFRRQGIGKALTEACLEKAQALGLTEVNLTSSPSREAANKLYQAMGFVQRETNVYRFSWD